MTKYLDYEGLEYYTNKIKTGMDSIIQNGTKNLINSGANVSASPTITFTINVDGSITFSCSSTNNRTFLYYYSGNRYIPNVYKRMVFSSTGDVNSDVNIGVLYSDNGINWTNEKFIFNNNSFIIGDYNYIQFAVYMKVNITVSSFTFYPMVCTEEIYKISKTYQPYAMTNYELTNNVATNLEIDNIWNGT